MTETQKITSALSQIDNLTILLEDNEWKTFLYSHLIPLKYELQRQQSLLTNQTNSTNIEE
jgi:sRNA-binding regulator protein Hfq